jgi:enterochelin esterase-like enzyme
LKRREALQGGLALAISTLAAWAARAETTKATGSVATKNVDPPQVVDRAIASADIRPVSAGRLLHFSAVRSAFAAPRDVWIWLPDSYTPEGLPHDVLYMHDGANLFEPGGAFGGKEWGVDEALTQLVGKLPPTLVVGIGNTPLRFREYMPKGVWARLPAEQRAFITKGHGGEPLSDGYLKFIVQELKPWVDAIFRTLPGPDHTHVMGSSMGGLISFYALGEYPEVFGGAACLSTHWPAGVPASLEPRPAAEVQGMAAAFAAWLDPHWSQLRGHRLYLDRGDATLDVLYPPFQDAIDQWLQGRAPAAGLQWQSRAFPGAEHTEVAWRARLAEPLQFLLEKPRN